jgi:hypothetical protein
MCADQSCRPSLADCPKAITCPNGYALCEDMTCRLSCANNFIFKSVPAKLARFLEKTETNKTKLVVKFSGNCNNTDYVTCPGGECAPNSFMCPTVESCPSNAVRCPDMSCA